jgi:TRAP-type C4-dicarboxylate transport system permease small subunit
MSAKLFVGKCYHLLDELIKYAIVIVFLVMVITGLAQVFNRYLLNQSLSWGEELQKFSHIWLIFLTIPLAYKNREHLGMNLFYRKMSRRSKFMFDLVIHLLWLSFGAILILITSDLVHIGALQKSPGLGIKMSWVYSGILIGNAYLVLTAIKNLVSHLRYSS